jgi:hypothetical protein
VTPGAAEIHAGVLLINGTIPMSTLAQHVIFKGTKA